ncbi:MAG TPA: CHAT domain-containing protein [Longimicrobiales bacterium]
MPDYASLDLNLSRAADGGYALEFVFSQPGSDAEARLLGAQPVKAALDLNALRVLLLDPAAYGHALAGQLFADPRARTAFVQARAAAGALPLRLRFQAAPGAGELHGLAWELLLDPQDSAPLATQEKIVFSRVLASSDSRPVTTPARGDLRALLAVASPSNLPDYNLARLDQAAELDRIQAELGEIETQSASGPGQPPATLEHLLDELQNGYDLFYLVCHGRSAVADYFLFLEDGQGMVNPTPGKALVQGLRGLAHPPRLVVMAACESAASDAQGVMFAARLAEAGIPAALAMQTKVSLPTMAGFMPVFFRELMADGQIDRAAAVARRAVSARPDFWAPVLLTCLRSGRLWQDPEPEKQAGKYNVAVQNSKGVIVGDNANVTMNFD